MRWSVIKKDRQGYCAGKYGLIFLCCYGLFGSAFAKEGKPFIHPFGELRVYYQDWLVVCENKGQGVCRMVNMKLDDPKDSFFGNSRLSVYPDSQQDRQSALPEYRHAATIEFFKRDAPPLQGVVSVAIDGKTIADLKPNVDVFDSSSKAISAETYLVEGQVAKRMIDVMPKGRWFSIRYWRDNTQVTERFSLRGAAKALAFMSNRIRTAP